MSRLIKASRVININEDEDTGIIDLNEVIKQYGIEKLKKETDNNADDALPIIRTYAKEVEKQCEEEYPSIARYIEFDIEDTGNFDATVINILTGLGFKEEEWLKKLNNICYLAFLCMKVKILNNKFIDKNKLFDIARKNTKYSKDGNVVIQKDDEWLYQNELDKLYIKNKKGR